VTNKNRQLLALDSTVGRPKCDVLAERLLDINPELDLVVIKEYLEAEKAGEVLGSYKIDFLVDAIDTLSPKLHLIKYCVDNGIPLVSSMGAGGKTDPSQITLADIKKSYGCPLARVMRGKLKELHLTNIPIVFSPEPPLRSFTGGKIGSISYIPAVFGCFCAAAAIRHLTGDNQ
jgi:tRNA A37 threonylcarbamoyladenosine dehydratase